MNHVYRTLWNAVTRSFVAVAENASAQGKRSSGSKARSKAADEAVSAAGPRSRRALVSTPPSLLRLEPRLVFDGAAIDTALAAFIGSAAVDAQGADKTASASSEAALAEAAAAAAAAAATAATAAASATAESADQLSNRTATGASAQQTSPAARHEVVFVDTRLPDQPQLLAQLPANVEVVWVDAGRDGLAQMAEWAATHSGYDAVHVLSHGSLGQLALGTSVIDANTLTSADAAAQTQQAEWAAVGRALTTDGDLLLYGCSVGADGLLIDRIAQLTQADVAASTNATGAAQLGADWTLEARQGAVQAVSLSADGWLHLLADPANLVTVRGTTPNDGLYVADSYTSADGSLWVTGGLNGTVDMDPGTGVTLLDAKANGITSSAVFVARYARDGSLLWAKSYNGTNTNAAYYESGSGIVADARGNVYVTGSIFGTVDFNGAAANGTAKGDAGNTGAFLLKLDAWGQFAWVANINGPTSDSGVKVTLDSSGNPYVAGKYFQSAADIMVSVGTTAAAKLGSLANGGRDNVFLAKFNPSGTLAWAKSALNAFDGGDPSVAALKVTADGDVIVTGYFFSLAAGGKTISVPAQPTDYRDGYVWMLGTDGTQKALWALGGRAATNDGYESTTAVAEDASGNVYLAGGFNGSNVDLDPGPGVKTFSSPSKLSSYVIKLDANNQLVDVKLVAASQANLTLIIDRMVVLPDGSLVIEGQELDYSNWARTTFVAGLSSALNPTWRRDLPGIYGSVSSMQVDGDGKLALSFTYSGTVDVDPGAATRKLVSGPAGTVYYDKYLDIVPYPVAEGYSEVVYPTSLAFVRWQPDASGMATYGPGATLASAVAVSTTAPLQAGQSVTINIDLSAPATDLSLDDLRATGGSLSDFSGSGSRYTVSFTPTPQFVGNATVTLAAGSFHDAANLVNTTDASLTLAVDATPATFSADSLVGSVDHLSLSLTASKALAADAALPLPSAFAVTVDGQAVAVSSVAVADAASTGTTTGTTTSGTTTGTTTSGTARSLVLRFASPLLAGSGPGVVRVVYSDPSAGDDANAVQTAIGKLDSASFDLSARNLKPVLATTSPATPTGWTEGTAAAAVDALLTLTDADDLQISGARVRISAGLTTGDLLGFTAPPAGSAIAGSYDAATGVLSFSGAASLADYQALLRTVCFSSSNPASTATSAARSIEWTVSDGDSRRLGAQTSAAISRSLAITAADQVAPVLDTSKSPALLPVIAGLGAPVNGVLPASATRVADLIDAGGTLANYSDADGDLPGIAITGVNAAVTLYFSTDNGATWKLASGVTEATALTLVADSKTWVYAMAKSGGTLIDAITVKAWGRNGGYTNGQTGVDASLLVAASTDYLTGPVGTALGVWLVDAAANTVVLADATGGARFLDMSNPNSPKELGRLGGTGIVIDIRMDANYVYLVLASDGLRIYAKVAGSAYTSAMKPVASTPSTASVTSVDVVGNMICVAQSDGQVRLFGWSNKALAPVAKGALNVAGRVSGLAMSGNTVFAAVGSLGLKLLDVTVPSSPSLLNSSLVGAGAVAVALSADGKTAYLACGANGLTVCDVSSPKTPVVLATLKTIALGLAGTTAQGLQLVGNTLWVANGAGGVSALDVSNPAAPVLKASADTAGNATGVAVLANGQLVVADGVGASGSNKGLAIVSRIVTFSTDTDTVSLVARANNAPVLAAGPFQLPDMLSSATAAPVNGSTAGSLLVSSLLGSAFSDADPGDGPGIALVGSNSKGTVWFSTNGGDSWQKVGAVTPASARLLMADANTRLYFQPDGSSGTLADAISFTAWDRQGGYVNGQAAVDTVANTAKAFGASTALASLRLQLPDTAPSFNANLDGVTQVALTGTPVALALDGQGRQLVLVQSGTYPLLTRLLPDGSPDPSVYTQGQVATANDVLVLPSGQIVLAMSTALGDIVLNCLDSNGKLQYQTSLDFASGADNKAQLAVDSQGRLVVACLSGFNDTKGVARTGVGVARLTVSATGTLTLDTSFGTGGKSLIRSGGVGFSVSARDAIGSMLNGVQLSVDSTGRVLVACTATTTIYQFAVAYRLTATGGVDQFNTGGYFVPFEYTVGNFGSIGTVRVLGIASGPQGDAWMVYADTTTKTRVSTYHLDANGKIAAGVDYPTTAVATSQAVGMAVDAAGVLHLLSNDVIGRPWAVDFTYTPSGLKEGASTVIDYKPGFSGLLVSAARTASGNWQALGLSGGSGYALALTSSDGTTAQLKPNIAAAGGTSTLGGTARFSQITNLPVLLDADVQLLDRELGASDRSSYQGVTVTLQRSLAANAGDLFGSTLFSGNDLLVGGQKVGSFTQAKGQLLLQFTEAAATRSAVNTVLRSITYSNTEAAPPASVTITWQANDGNTGAQGAGGALDSVLGTTTVNVTAKPLNTAPVLKVTGGLVNPKFAAGDGSTGFLFPDATVTLTDAELIQSLRGVMVLQYPGASLTVQRAGGANADDRFKVQSFGAVVSQAGGTLTATFGANTSITAVTSFLNNLQYGNAGSQAGEVALEISFSDGNTGQQGSGGAKSSTITQRVSVTAPRSVDARTTAVASSQTGPVDLPSTATSAASAVPVYRFTLTDNDVNGDGLVDSGTSDGLPSVVSSVTLQVSDALADGLSFLLNGPLLSAPVKGVVASTAVGGLRNIVFNTDGMGVMDATQGTVTVSAYRNAEGLFVDNTLGTLRLAGSDIAGRTPGLLLDKSGSQLLAIPLANPPKTGVTDNGSWTLREQVTATQLVFATQPDRSELSGQLLSAQPVLQAVDSAGEIDLDFNGPVTLSATGAGSLSGAAGLTVNAVRGVATFAGLVYTAAADQEAVTLNASADGLGKAATQQFAADVVATRLVFSAQPPASTAITSGVAVRAEVSVQAVDAQGTVDTGFNGVLTLSLTDPTDGALDGTLNELSVKLGDSDSNPGTVTVNATSGLASFSNLVLRYTNGGPGDTLALVASSAGVASTTGETLNSRLPAAANTAPVIAAHGKTSVSWTEANSANASDNLAVAVAAGFTLSDAEQAAPASLTISLPDAQAGERLLLGDTPASLAWTFAPGDTSVTLSAKAGASAPTMADFQTTLRGIRYAYDTNAPDTTSRLVTITVDDGQASNNSASLDVTVLRAAVNDAPSAADKLPPSQTIREGAREPLQLSSLGQFTDPDGDSLTLSVTVSVTPGVGKLYAYPGKGLTITGIGTHSLVLTGTTGALSRYFENARDAVSYVGGKNISGLAADTVTVSADDGFGAVTLGTMAINLTPVNDAPTLAGLPELASGTLMVGLARELDDFSVADVDSNKLTVTLTPSNGSLGGLVDADPAPGVQITGTPAAINAALAAATFTASAAGGAGLAVSVSDGELSASGSYPLPKALNPNTPPTLATVAAQTFATGERLSLGFISATDPDTDQTLTLTLSTSNATLRGLQDADVFTAGLQLRGSAASLNAALAAATLTANADGAVSVSASLSDGVATNPATATYTLTAANVAPTLTSVSALAGGEEDTLSAISFSKLLAASNAADPGGAVQAFVVQAVSSGSLKINGNAWANGTNDLIDADHSAEWTPVANAFGVGASALNAFTVKARDNSGALSASAVQVKVEVASVNDSPTQAGVYAFTDITEDSAGSTGVRVSALLGSLAAADVESIALGVAITGSSALGNWQYSSNSTNGSDGSWTAVGAVLPSSARLLPADDWLRYRPDQAHGETAQITLRAWDGSTGVAHGLANAVANGGATAFSATAVTATMVVAALDDALSLTLTDTAHATQTYLENADLALDATLTLNDPDATGLTLTGSRAYISAGLVSAEDSLLINGLTNGNVTLLGDTISFSYNNLTGVMSLDGSASQDAYQAALRLVTYRNLSDNPTLAARTIDLVAGTTLATTLGGQIHFYDYVLANGSAGHPRQSWTQARDAAALRSYAGMTGYLVTVTSAAENDFLKTALPGSAWIGASDAAAEGRWFWVTGPEAGQQFWQVDYDFWESIDASYAKNGLFSNWNPGEPNNSGGAFVTDYDGVENYASIVNGSGKWNDREITDNNVNGYLVEYSDPAVTTVVFSKRITVTPQAQNDAPVLSAASPTLTAIDEDAISSVGQLVSSLVSLATISDADPGAVRGGIAITATDSGNGQWQYRLNNAGAWTSVGTPSDSAALLLTQADALRFVPNGLNASTGSFSYRAWDATTGSAGLSVNTSTNGGSSAFSTAVNTASITVSAVNDAPVIAAAASVTMTAISEDVLSADNPGQTVASLLGSIYSDVDLGATSGVALVGKSGPGTGLWQYSIDAGTNWLNTPALADTSALLLGATDLLRFSPDGLLGGPATLTLRGWDQSTGVHGNTPNISTTLGASHAFSNLSAALSLTVASVNDAALLTASGGGAAYTELAAAVAIDAGLTLSDDSASLSAAKVAISAGFTDGDRLNFSTQAGISGSFNAETCVLTLTGSASVADWRTALRSVSFSSTSHDPTALSAARTLQLTVTDAEGLTSAAATRALAITAVADAATATALPTNFKYTEDDGARVLAPDLLLIDRDDIDLASARVTLAPGANGFVAASELLGLSDAAQMTANGTGWTATVGAISLTYTRSTGQLDLSGTASVTDYRKLLRSVTYTNAQDYSANPGGVTLAGNDSRSIAWQVTDANSDGLGASTALLGNTAITLHDAKEVPQVTGANTGAAYTENGASAALAAGLTVLGDPTLARATVRIGAGYSEGDALGFTNQGGITGSWSASEGLLTLSGSASLANYQAALRSVSFSSSSDNPTASSATRTLRWQILDNAGSPSAVDADATTTLTITAVNDVASLSGLAASGSVTVAERGEAVSLARQLQLTDLDDAKLASAQVLLGGAGFDAAHEGLRLAGQTASTGSFTPGSNWTMANVAGSGVAAGYVAATGTLSLTGAASVEQYQQLLQRVQFQTAGDDPTATAASRSLSWTVTDANGSNAGNGALTSAAASSGATVTAVNNAASLTGLSGVAVAATERVAMQPGSAIVLSDADDTQLASARVWISGGLSTGDTLAFTNANGISASYDATTGVLALTGTASVAQYQAALRSVSFDTGTDPTALTAERVISWQLTDANSDGAGAARSEVASVLLSLTAVNDAPVITAAATPSFTEGGAAVVIDGALTISDIDDQQIAGASVSIATGLTAGDLLASPNGYASTSGTTGISASYNAGTGVLTLTGTASVAAYQTALRAVSFRNTSGEPTDNGAALNRGIAWAVTDANSDGVGAATSAAGGTAASSITVQAVNSAPMLSAGGQLAYTEGGVASVLDNSITLSDVDDTQMSGAVLRIFNGWTTGDTLGFTNQNGIVGFYDAATGVLTLIGNASVANYQTALRSVTFSSSSDDPTITSVSRTVSIQVTDANSDGAGAATSNTAGAVVNVTATGDAPSIAGQPVALAWTEADPALTLAPALTISDADDSQLSQATVQLDGRLKGDALGWSAAALTGTGISADYSATTGVLVFSGAADLSAYQALLRTVSYRSSSDDPTDSGAAPTRTLRWTVTDANSDSTGKLDSATVSSTLTITGINGAPVVTLPVPIGDWTEGDAAVLVSPNLSLSDIDSSHLTGATLRTSGAWLGDQLLFSTQNGITGSYNAAVGLLTLTGTATLGQYQTALRSVQFSNGSEYPAGFNVIGGNSIRTFTWTASDDATPTGTSAAATSMLLVKGVNDAPTFSAMSGAVGSAVEDGSGTSGRVAFTLANLKDSANARDVDGWVTAWRVTELNSGKLLIGATEATATAWSAEGNATIDATFGAWWTPAANANGAALPAFKAVAVDNQGAESETPVQVTTQITAVPDAALVTGVDLPPPGTYAIGDTLDFTVNYDREVTVSTAGGTPRLLVTLDTGGTVAAQYVSGSASKALVFRMTVASGALDADGISVAGSIALNGGTLTNVDDGQPANAGLTLTGLGSSAGLKVDGVAPGVQTITVSGAANAATARYTVTLGESVTGMDAKDFVLKATGTATGRISAVTGSGSSYTVTVADIDGTGGLRLDARASGTGIRDAAGNAIVGGFTNGAVHAVARVAPTLAITSGIAKDNVLNATEAGSALTMAGTTSAEDGQTVTLGLGGQTHSASVSGRAWAVTLQPAELKTWAQGLLTMTADVSDQAGNVAITASAKLTVDTLAPTLTADVVADDNRINASEAGAGLTLSGSTSAEDGQTVTLGLGSRSQRVLASGGRWSASFAAAELAKLGDGDLPLQLLVTDAAGNATIASRMLQLDRSAPVVVVDPVAGDDRLNAVEQRQALTITGSASGAEDGQLLSLTLGALTKTAQVTNGLWSVKLTATELQTLADGDLALSTDLRDLAGNMASPANRTLQVDTAAPVLGLDAVTGDDVINLAEHDSGFVLSGTANEGSTVIVAIGSSAGMPVLVENGRWQRWVGADQLPAASATQVPVTLRVTDAAGNTSTLNRTLAMNAVATMAPALRLATGTNGTNAAAGISGVDSLVLSGAAAGVKLVYTVNGELSYDLAAALVEGDNEVSVLQVDAAGNVSAPSAPLQLKLDRTAPRLTLANADPDTGVDQVTLAENSATSVPIYTVQANDEGKLVYSLRPGVGDADLLAIDPATGAVTLSGAAADHESGKTAYRFTVVATDAAGNRSLQAVVVQVLNLNDNAPQAALRSDAVSVDEGRAAGELAGAQVIASDADGDTLVFSLVNAPVDAQGQALFSIDSGTGQLSLTEAGSAWLDADSGTSAYRLTLRTSDGLAAHDQLQVLTVAVNNLNDNAPVLTLPNTQVSLPENAAAGDIAGAKVSASDADGDPLLFSLVDAPVDGQGLALFAIDAASGQLRLTDAGAAATDYESGVRGFQLTVQVGDGDAAHDRQQTLAVSLSNVNDNAPVLTLLNAQVNIPENAAAGNIAGAKASASDADGDPLLFSLVRPPVDSQGLALFAIDAASGQLRLTKAGAAALDYESSVRGFQLTVQVGDGDAAHDRQQTLALSVANVNDNAPVLTLLNEQLSIPENAAAGDIAGAKASASDADGDPLSFSLVNAPVDAKGLALFAIGAASGQVRLTSAGAVALDYESDVRGFQLTVRVGDGDAAHNQQQTMAVSLSNVNDNAPVLRLLNTQVSIPENAAAGDIAGAKASASDADGDTISFSLVDTPVDAKGLALFAIDAASGQLRLTDAGAVALDFETRPLYQLQVQVSDGLAAHARTALLTVALTDVVESSTLVASPAAPPAAAPPAAPAAAPVYSHEAPPPAALSQVVEAAAVAAPAASAAPSAPAALAAAAAPAAPLVDRPAAAPVSTTTPTTPPAEAARLTQGFPVQVLTSGNSADAGLRLQRELPEQLYSGGTLRVQLPADAFVHSNAGATVTLQAVMASGSALPAWLSFDANRGEFVGVPPAGLRGELVLRVIARDESGRQAETTVRIRLESKVERSGALGGKALGKSGLSAQLQRQGVYAWKAERDRLVRLAREATPSQRHG